MVPENGRMEEWKNGKINCHRGMINVIKTVRVGMSTHAHTHTRTHARTHAHA
jgi:hypothetical protein